MTDRGSSQTHPDRALSARLLACLWLGMLSVPWAFVAQGAFAQFGGEFLVISAPILAMDLYLLVESLLGRRFLRVAHPVMVLVSALCVIWLVWTLREVATAKSERLGLLCFSLAFCSLIWLAASIAHGPTAFERWLASTLRGSRISRVAGIAVLAAYATLTFVACRWLVTPSQFVLE